MSFLDTLRSRKYSRESEPCHLKPRPCQKSKVRRTSPSQDARDQRHLVVDILESNATRRDAKQFIARIGRLARANQPDLSGVGLGVLADSVQFTQSTGAEKLSDDTQTTTHITLVSIKDPQSINDQTLDAIAFTISQLIRLHSHVAVILNVPSRKSTNPPRASSLADHRRQAARVVHALVQHNPAGARHVDALFDLDQSDSTTKISLPELLLDPLKRTVIPVITALAYNPNNVVDLVSFPDAMFTLTTTLSGLASKAASSSPTQTALSLDRIVMIDSQGGVPSARRQDRGHVFINLEHEFRSIIQGLDDMQQLDPLTRRTHANNLQILHKCLAILPPETSALIVSPADAASSLRPTDSNSIVFDTATRRRRNPLIHNLLTNRPMVSSTLPSARLIGTSDAGGADRVFGPTLVRRGMPLLTVPDLIRKPLSPNGPRLDLTTHTEINLSRLLSLIELSFRRRLDLSHYLARLHDKVAGVIIAGEYEGAAILTYELPSSSSAPIPYLDKLAVAPRSQGSAGVADIVFHTVGQNAFPGGFIWRSKSSNPVNMWYFERAIGMWKLPRALCAKATSARADTDAVEKAPAESEWTMFWTTKGVESDPDRWADYVAVCSQTEPSWVSEMES